MKWLLIAVVLAALIVGVFWWQDQQPAAPADAVPQIPASGVVAPSQGAALPAPAAPAAETPVTVPDEAERLAQADAVQAQIKTLMADFDEHRFDDDRREAIQAEINVLMAEYNELILPVATAKIKSES